MKLKTKKLWILHNYEEKVEETDGFCEESFIGYSSMGMYCGEIGATEGSYIIMPFDGDVARYRKDLIARMIINENAKIKRAERNICKLTNILLD